jgi:DNA-directed RNA polymerase alpha subunit
LFVRFFFPFSESIDKFNALETLTINFDKNSLFAVKYALGTIAELFSNIKLEINEPIISEQDIKFDEKLPYDISSQKENETVFNEAVDINILNLKLRIINILKGHNINSIQQLLNYSAEELVKLTGITVKTVKDIEEELDKKELKLRTS